MIDGHVYKQFTVKVTSPSEPGVDCVTIILEYRDTRPYEVRMIISPRKRWVFARDTLRDGTRLGVAGMADVQIWNDGNSRLFIRLSSPDGEATIEFSLTEIRQFLTMTRHLVPFSREEMNMDLVIAKIFQKETR